MFEKQNPNLHFQSRPRTSLYLDGGLKQIFPNFMQVNLANMVLLSFLDIQNIWIFTKFGGCSSKIEPAMPISIINFKWGWQAQFYRPSLRILVNDRSYVGHQVTFQPIFCICSRKAGIWVQSGSKLKWVYTLTDSTLSCPKSLLKTTKPSPGYPWHYAWN